MLGRKAQTSTVLDTILWIVFIGLIVLGVGAVAYYVFGIGR